MKKAQPLLNKRIFWDVDFASINYNKDDRFVIERVFDRGDVDDIRQVRRYYGDKIIKEEIKKAKWIDPETLQFLSAIYNIPLKQFRCYTEKQLRNQLSIY